MKDNPVARQIEDAFDMHGDPSATPEAEGRNGFSISNHRIAERFQYVYNAIKQEKAGIGEYINPIDIKSMNYTKQELDNISAELNKIEFEDGMRLADMGTERFNQRMVKSSADGIKKGYEDLMRVLSEMGLPITEISADPSKGKAKFHVGKIGAKNTEKELDVLMDYNNLVSELVDMNIVEHLHSMDRPGDSFKTDEMLTDIYNQFDITIEGFNREFNLSPVERKIAENPFLDIISHTNKAESIERLFQIMEGGGVTETDKKLAQTSVRLFNRAKGASGFLKSIDNYDFDYSNWLKNNEGKTLDDAKNEYNEADLKAQLRPVLEMLRVNNSSVVRDPSKSNKKLDIDAAAQVAKQFDDIIKLLPSHLRKDFKEQGADFFIKDMLSSQNIEPRVVNSIVEMQALGLGNYSAKDKKVEVMSIDAIRAQAQYEFGKSFDEAMVTDIQVKAQEMYDAIGSRYIEQKDFILGSTEDKTFKVPSITDFKKVYDNFQNEKIKDFVENADRTIELLKSTNYTQGKIEDITSGLTKLALDPISGETLSRLQEISVELKNIRHGNKFGKTYDKLIKATDDLINDIDRVAPGEEIGRNIDPVNYQKKIKSMHEYLESMFNMEAEPNNAIQQVVMDLKGNLWENHPAVRAKLIDSASIYLKKLLGEQKNSSTSLNSLLLDVHETGSWNAAKKFITGLENQIAVHMSANEPLMNKKTEQDSFERLVDDKKIHHSSETIQTIAQKFGLTDPDNPNDISADIVRLIVDNKESKNLIKDLTKEVDKKIAYLNLTNAEKLQRKALWNDELKYSFANAVLRQRTRKAANIVFDGKTAILNVNNKSSFRDTPVTEWMDSHKFDVTYISDNIVRPNQNTGKLEQVALSEFSQDRSSNTDINNILKKGVQAIPESNYDIMADVALGKAIDPDKIARYKDEAETGHFMEAGGFYNHLSPGTRILFHGTPENYRRLNESFKATYDGLKGKFIDTESVRTDGEKQTIRGEVLNKVFEEKFGYLRDIENPSTSESQLKMQVLFYSNSSKGMFNQWLAAVQLGNWSARKKLEANMVKRGWLVDGGTTVKPHPTVIKDMARNHSDMDVREVASELEANNMKTKTIIFQDESKGAGTNIKKRVLERFTAKKLKASEDPVSQHIYNQMLNDINNDKIPSLDMPLTDGAKYIDKSLAKMFLSIKGQSLDDLGGIKTIIFQLGDDNLLGKGYAVYDPIVADNFPKGVRVAMGKSAAKDFNPTKSELAIPGKDWYTKLSNATKDNIIDLNIENIGLGFTSKPTKGVSISNSMMHFEDIAYKKALKKVINPQNTLDILDRTTMEKQSSGSKLVEYLNQIKKDEGFVQTQGELGLTADIINAGGTYNNPAIRKSADRALRNEYFKLLSSQTTKYGRDLTIVPDAESALDFPEIVEFTQAEPFGGKFRVNKTFGDVSPSLESMSDPMSNLNNTSFIAKYKDIDFLINGDGSIYSPYLEVISKNQDLNFAGDNPPDIPKYNKKALYKDVKAQINPLLEKINSKFAHTNLSMKDIYTLLNGGKVPNKFTQIKLSKKYKDIVKNLDITLGLDGLAIPLKGKDKVLHRVRNAHEHTGLIKINHYDERVVHQRDNDGDHFYIYTQLPFEISKDHSSSQAFMKDFNMLAKDDPDINLFGIDEAAPESRAGLNPDVGIGKYTDHLDKQRFGIGKIIGDRGAIDYLSELGIQIDSKDMVWDLSKVSNLDDNDSKVANNLLTIFQNIVDIHGGTAPVVKHDVLTDVARNNEIPYGITQKYENGDKYNPPANGIFKQGASKKIEKDIQDLVLRTVKKVNILGQDVYDQGTQRAPEPFEISSAYNDLISFFTNPTNYVVEKLAYRYKRDRTKGSLQDIIDYFYTDRKDYKVGEKKSIDSFIDDFMKGKIPSHFKTRITFKNFPNIKRDLLGYRPKYDAFDIIPQGEYLRTVVNKEIFHNIENLKSVDPKIHKKLGSVVNDALNRLNFLELAGKSPQDLIDFHWGDSVLDFDKVEPSNITGAIGRGAIRSALNSMYKGLAGQARHYNANNSKFQDNKAFILNEKMKSIESAISILDAQYAKNVIGSGKTQNAYFHESFKQESRAVKGDKYVLRYKGSKENITNLIDENKLDLSQFDHIGWVKDKDTYQTYRNNTYIELNNPQIQESTTTNQYIYSKAMHDLTVRHEASHVFENDIDQNIFLDDVFKLRKEISDNFSGAIHNSKSRPLSKAVWRNADINEKALLNNFYKNNIEKIVDQNPDMGENDAANFLTRYLIKPQPILGKYITEQVDGTKLELPYYNLNNRLVSSVYKYLKATDRMDIVERIVDQQEKYVRNEYTEEAQWAETNYNMYRKGYNYDNLENADLVRSLGGYGFTSPYWSQKKYDAGVDFTNPQVYKTFDDAKQVRIKKKIKDETECR